MRTCSAQRIGAPTRNANAIESLGRRNFGLQYDAANLFETGEEYRGDAIRALGSSIYQISVQNSAPCGPDEPDAFESSGRWYRRCLIGDPAGLEFEAIFEELRAIGFDGCVVVNEPKPAILGTREFARRSREGLRTITAR